jgi:oligopeptide/dipeptide ABC transporter ATP-binding protein
MPGTATQYLLDVDRMVVDFREPAPFRVLEDISFSMERGTALVILGESGSGKTVLSRALTGLFPPHRRPVLGGSVVFDGKQILTENINELRHLRKNGIRYVFQDPMQALNPVAKIGAQLRLAAPQGAAAGELAALLAEVDLGPGVLGLYPHQLSVGMAQRVAIAMAVIAPPTLLIADEPTSALDVTLCLQVMDLVSHLCKTRNVGLLLITHDLGIAHRYGDNIVLLLHGQIVESAPVRDFFSRPYHPYARLLKDLHPLSGKTSGSPLGDIPGHDLPSSGCRFSNQCPLVRDRCRSEEPVLEQAGEERKVRCFFWK